MSKIPFYLKNKTKQNNKNDKNNDLVPGINYGNLCAQKQSLTLN